MVLIYGAWPSALGWIVVISWSFMLTTGPNMGTTKRNIFCSKYLIFNTRNYILSYDCRLGLGLSGHLKEKDTKQENLLILEFTENCEGPG